MRHAKYQGHLHADAAILSCDVAAMAADQRMISHASDVSPAALPHMKQSRGARFKGPADHLSAFCRKWSCGQALRKWSARPQCMQLRRSRKRRPSSGQPLVKDALHLVARPRLQVAQQRAGRDPCMPALLEMNPMDARWLPPDLPRGTSGMRSSSTLRCSAQAGSGACQPRRPWVEMSPQKIQVVMCTQITARGKASRVPAGAACVAAAPRPRLLLLLRRPGPAGPHAHLAWRVHWHPCCPGTP